jgi:hypothetical protein
MSYIFNEMKIKLMSLMIAIPTGDYSATRNDATENNPENVCSSHGKVNSIINITDKL